MADFEHTPEKTILIVAAVAGVLLLLAPVVPPQGALFGFVALLVLGVALLWGSRLIRMKLSALVETSEPEQSPTEELQERYITGELTDEEFETELEKTIGLECQGDNK